MEPDEVSLKSLRLLEPKLKWLAEHALFGVNINSVVGAGIKNPEDALAVARRARELGLHELGRHPARRTRPARAALGSARWRVYEELKTFGSRGDTRFNAPFQDNLVHGRPNDWSCRAGARYLYVDEYGLVQLLLADARDARRCPLESYTRADIAPRVRHAKKPARPYCTVNCAQRVALFDNWRAPQNVARGCRPRPPAPAGPRRRGARRADGPVPRRAAAPSSPAPRSGIGEAFARALRARGAAGWSWSRGAPTGWRALAAELGGDERGPGRSPRPRGSDAVDALHADARARAASASTCS